MRAPLAPLLAALLAPLAIATSLPACSPSGGSSSAGGVVTSPTPARPEPPDSRDGPVRRKALTPDLSRTVGERPPLGGPVSGLSASELAAFERGKKVFERRFRPSDGLGPMYNATSCVSCHSTPVTGGAARLYRNFYVAMRGDLVQAPIPGLQSLVIPAFGRQPEFTLEEPRIEIPPDGVLPVRVAQRNSIPIFGVGLFEFVPDAEILSRADPDDEDGDGISGRYNTDILGVGRMGLKAQANNIETFTRTPIFTQMGITTEPLLGSAGAASLSRTAIQASGFDPDRSTIDGDGVPDPELSRADLADLIAFTRFLAPPGRVHPPSESARLGEASFLELGCAKCHVPALDSSRGPVEAYTDLLIHDMGPDLADHLSLGNPQQTFHTPFGTGTEWRTQPLWGVSLVGPWLHDGRAETLFEAIEMHGGEAQASRDAFLALPPDERAHVLAFLESL